MVDAEERGEETQAAEGITHMRGSIPTGGVIGNKRTGERLIQTDMGQRMAKGSSKAPCAAACSCPLSLSLSVRLDSWGVGDGWTSRRLEIGYYGSVPDQESTAGPLSAQRGLALTRLAVRTFIAPVESLGMSVTVRRRRPCPKP